MSLFFPIIGGPSLSLPSAIIAGLDTGGLITPDDTPTIIGYYVDPTGGSVSGVTIHIFKDGVEVGTATTDGSGNWSYTFASTPQGTYTITAEADFPSPLSSPFNFTVTASASGLDTMAALLLCQSMAA